MRSRLLYATVIAFLLVLTVPVFCQQPAPAFISITRIQVKADRIAEFQELAKQRVESVKKAAPANLFNVMCRVAVGNTAEFWVFSPMNKFADRDGENKFSTPQERATWNARGSQNIERIQTSIERPINDLLVIKNGTNGLPAFIRYSRIRVRPGSANDFINIVKTDIIPVIKKINGEVRISQVAFGGNTNEFAVGTPFEKWAELDDTTTFLRALGGEAALKKLGEKLDPIIVNSEQYILRVMPDLSYVPAQAAASSSR